MDYKLGCNYWASHAGTEMWRKWVEIVVDNDLRILSENGVEYFRVFPLWRDFQPVMPLFDSNGVYEYRLESENYTDNSYYLDNNMMERFDKFCRIAGKYNIKLIVALITGWMSGRLFVPPVLNAKNPITDITAMMFEQKFVKGFVERFKDTKNIYAWDLGNECNEMGNNSTRQEAYSWSAMITNAIKAADSSRPVISGMHSLKCEQGWTIADQGEITDILTTHPYPYWVRHCSVDPINTMRTLLHATAQTEYYASISGKPCLVEELGTMGPMVCSEEIAGDFMRLNLFSNFVNGAEGLLWWCANEQANLQTAPYAWNMCERELGFLDKDMKPKPALLELKKFSEFLKTSKLTLAKPKKDAVCILTKGQDHWGIAYMTYVLAKQAGINISFSYADDGLSESDFYFLPSVKGHLVMAKRRYDEIKQRVYDGATLYVSLGDCILSDFEQLTSVQIITSHKSKEHHTMNLNGIAIDYSSGKRYSVESVGAEVIAADETDTPCFTKADYGKGKVYMLSFPLEEMILDKQNMCDGEYFEIYKEVCKDILGSKAITTTNKYIALTEHISENGNYYAAINYSSHKQEPKLKLKEGIKIKKVIYGSKDNIKPCDALIFEA